MGENSKIEWCDHTFNGWIGCTEVSPACDHCYARILAGRYGWAEWGVGKPRHRTSADNWKKPLAWDRKAAKLGIRYRVFANSLSDVFDKEVPDAWRDDLMALIEATPNLDWLLLTKRPKVMREYFERRGSVPLNVWAGTTVENQPMAELRIPEILRIQARVHFLSVEPLLEAVDLEHIPLTKPDEHSVFRTINALTGRRGHGSNFGYTETTDPLQPHLSWVIVGGESGDGWRPINDAWVRSMRDQCAAADVPFFFKQWAGRNPKVLGRMIDGQQHSELPA